MEKKEELGKQYILAFKNIVEKLLLSKGLVDYTILVDKDFKFKSGVRA